MTHDIKTVALRNIRASYDIQMIHDEANAALSAPEQPVPAADVPGPWHDWAGGECPVAGEIHVDVKYKDSVQRRGKACIYYWDHDGASDDIIAWRYAAVTPAAYSAMKTIIAITALNTAATLTLVWILFDRVFV